MEVVVTLIPKLLNSNHLFKKVRVGLRSPGDRCLRFMSKPAAAAKKAGVVGAAADANAAVKKVGAASGPLDKRLQVKSNADDDDWSKWNIQELRTSMVEDRANLQVIMRSPSRASFHAIILGHSA